jgi:hypothetical protein
VRSKDISFLISISGAGVPAAETTIDQARNEMTMTGMPRENVEAIITLLKLQYKFARTGQGWDEYAAAREKLAARMGNRPTLFQEHRITPTGDLSSGSTSTIPFPPFVSSTCQH